MCVSIHMFWVLDLDSFPIDDRGTMKSVVQYFQETYGFVIKHTTWPCLQVGNQQRPNYLPMEVKCVLFKNFLVTFCMIHESSFDGKP